MTRRLVLAAAVLFVAPALAQPPAEPPAPAPPGGTVAKRIEAKPADDIKLAKEDLESAVKRGIAVLLAIQEDAGEGGKAQWAYEGVYRVPGPKGSEIPVGYRIGGTAIASLALIQAPDYKDDAERREAVGRARDFVVKSLQHPLMSIDDYDAGYDVRGWGYTYGLLFLVKLKTEGLVPADRAADVEKALAFCLDGIERTQIPTVGGWNYARPAGKDKPGAPSPFMTGPTLQALFAAKAAGYPVNTETVEKGLKFLKSAMGGSGTVVYSGPASSRAGKSDGVPGAIGRMCCTESTLAMAGLASTADVRGAVDSFIVHWKWLDQRRQKPGTHEAPYMVAPYYFMFAHYFAAQAVELLPAHEQAEYKRRINQLLFSVRGDDGTWNDRVFTRSSGFGTAMAMMAIMGPERYKWSAETEKK